MAVVTFDPAAFKLLYPAFNALSDAQLNNAFALAQGYVANTDCAIVPYSPPTVTVRGDVLNLVTGHIAAMIYGANGQAPSGLVGRVSSAAQGTVNVQVDMPSTPAAAWWNQTTWGAMAWQLLAPYRTARYRPSPGRFAQGVYGRGPPPYLR